MTDLGKIEQDHRRFKKIVRGKIKENLRDYMSEGELTGKQGKDTVKVPVPRIDLPRFTVATPFPGTPFYRRLQAQGRLRVGGELLDHLFPKVSDARGHVGVDQSTCLKTVRDLLRGQIAPAAVRLGFGEDVEDLPDGRLLATGDQSALQLDHVFAEDQISTFEGSRRSFRAGGTGLTPAEKVLADHVVERRRGSGSGGPSIQGPGMAGGASTGSPSTGSRQWAVMT